MADPDERPVKIPKVQQNHDIRVTHIDNSTMDHYVSVVIHPDRMFPEGTIKRGIKLGPYEFNKACKVLSERCSYRLLTPLSNFSYVAYLNKATEDFLKNRNDDGGGRPVVQVRNQSPFKFKSKNYVCSNSSNVLQVFEIFSARDSNKGFAVQVRRDDLPFIINWSGPDVKPMTVNDQELLQSLVKIIAALDAVQPNVEGLGVCVLAEFARFLIYGLLVDGEQNEDVDSSDDEADVAMQENDFFRGYKQMILILQSETVETGKSFLSEMLARMFHGSKHGISSTISFDSARKLLGKGEPVIIDDYSNDDVGCVLLSRASKAIWGQSAITMRGISTTPNANLLLCTNEIIKNLKVEGKSKTEIFQKMSIIDLGEEPLSKSVCENKGEKFKEILQLAKSIRKVFPSFCGLSLQICGSYITSEEFKEYSEITKHERLGNILKNCKKLYDELNRFCEKEPCEKPKSLKNKLDTSCLTNKSELTIKHRSPDQIAEILMATGVTIVVTKHGSVEGIAFDFRSLSTYSWFKATFDAKKDGVNVSKFKKMRTRQLNPEKNETSAAFVSFEHLTPALILKIKDYAVTEDDSAELDDSIDLEDQITDPKVIIAKRFDDERKEIKKVQEDRCGLAEKFIKRLVSNIKGLEKPQFPCVKCVFVSKSKGGLANHYRSCNPKKK